MNRVSELGVFMCISAIEVLFINSAGTVSERGKALSITVCCITLLLLI